MSNNPLTFQEQYEMCRRLTSNILEASQYDGNLSLLPQDLRETDQFAQLDELGKRRFVESVLEAVSRFTRSSSSHDLYQ